MRSFTESTGSGLLGKRVVVTRAREQAEAMCATLARLGAEPIAFPTIAFEPVAATVDSLASYDWVLFTSATGVRFFFDGSDSGSPSTWPPDVRIGAVGPATRAALEARDVPVHAMPKAFVGEALVAALGNATGARVLLPRAQVARRDVVDALAAAGARVDDLPVYRTVIARPDADALAALRQGVDMVTFTSPSTLRNFLSLLGDEGRAVLVDAVVATIGIVTARAARGEGVRVDVEPDVHTTEALIEALARHVEVA